ncbi:hypothetical protein CQW23_06317 [Capsicum baccatum]|uniref:Disease resistance protein winged helix domain-containing protein n=1 Tax=Capsicum baccatum TaxID=33114 RepID=A0A2G2X2Z6_CAPBA|nr:hypothetical protein CQW23_06317 [Capsicum baccatum]
MCGITSGNYCYAGLLSKIGEALDEWRSVSENVSSVISTDPDVQCMRVLALSYHHLPHHLRPCFLYFTIFPEDKVIYVNKLVKLWAAEGFLKVETMKSIEEVAEKCVKDLIDRNLIFIHRESSFDGKIKACGMHDVIRELCLIEDRNKNFVNVITDNQNPCKQSRYFSKKQVRISIRSKQSKLVSSQLSMVQINDSCSVLLFTEDTSSSIMIQELKRFKCLSGWNPLSCTSSMLRLLPYVKKLQICGIQEDYIRRDKVFHDLCRLDQLTKLKFKIRKIIGRPIYDTSFALPPLGTFPKNLTKLAFTGTRLHWEDLGILGKLPKPEALKLGYDACIGADWEVGEGGFPHLKLLRLKHLYLHNWRASSDHFPCLKRLVINRCWIMYSIPQDFVGITTLQLIHISDCAKSVGISAKNIQHEIEDNYGNSVEVRIN